MKLIIIGLTGPAVHTRQVLSWAVLWSTLGVCDFCGPGPPLHWSLAAETSMQADLRGEAGEVSWRRERN